MEDTEIKNGRRLSFAIAGNSFLISFPLFCDVNMSTKSKTDSEFSRVPFGEIPLNLAHW